MENAIENEFIIQKIKEADMVLVGIGEEFDEARYLKNSDGYQHACEVLRKKDMEWALPALDRAVLAKEDGQLKQAYEALNRLLEGKNYFILTTVANDLIWDSGLNPERIAAPCGGSRRKQCPDGCSEGLLEVSGEEWEGSRRMLLELAAGEGDRAGSPVSGICPGCQKPLVFNNIFNEHYDENGYLPSWQLYTKWLQGTLNRKLCVLELGVLMKLPNIIRWPFEKAAYFNQKASFIRVNERLYQLSKELSDKGISVPQNALDWLCGL